MLYCSIAEEMWKELVERFGQPNKAKLFQVKKEMSGISQGDSDIATYYTRAKRIWDEYAVVNDMPRCTCNKCECGINTKLMKYIQEQNMIHFLMGLNESYTSVRGNLLMMNPLPSLGQTYSLLIQEEMQRQVNTTTHFLSDSASSFSAGTQKQSYPRKPDGRRNSQIFCHHCKRQGHTIDKCYKIHGYPNKQLQSFKQKGVRFANSTWVDGEISTEIPKPTTGIGPNHSSIQSPQSITLPGLDPDQSRQLLQFLAGLHASKQPQGSSPPGFSTAYMAGMNPGLLQNITFANTVCCTCKLDGKIWIVDSGASDHMVFDKNLLYNIRTLKIPTLITLPNGNKVKVSQVEDLKIGSNLILHHALFVPFFQFDHLSVKRLSVQLKC